MTVADAVLARLLALVPAAPSPQYSVFDAAVPSEPPARYQVLYPDPGMRTYVSLSCEADELRFTFQVTSVGSTRPEVDWLVRRSRDGLTGLVLEVAGLTCSPIEQAATQPIRHDTEIPNRLVLFGVDQYELTAQPI